MQVKKDTAERIIREDIDGWELVENNIIDNSRWSIQFEAIVKNLETGKFYSVDYSTGATECQDQEMFYEEWVEFTEVEQKEVLVTKWVVVKE